MLHQEGWTRWLPEVSFNLSHPVWLPGIPSNQYHSVITVSWYHQLLGLLTSRGNITECSVIQAHISSHPILWRKNSAIQLSHKPGFLTDTCLGTCSQCRFPKFNYNRVTSLLEWHETWEPALRNLEWKPEKTHISKYSQNVRLHRYNLQTQRKKYQKIFQIFITSYQRRWLFC